MRRCPARPSPRGYQRVARHQCRAAKAAVPALPARPAATAAVPASRRWALERKPFRSRTMDTGNRPGRDSSRVPSGADFRCGAGGASSGWENRPAHGASAALPRRLDCPPGERPLLSAYATLPSASRRIPGESARTRSWGERSAPTVQAACWLLTRPAEREQYEGAESGHRWNHVENRLNDVILRLRMRQAEDAEDTESDTDEKEHDRALDGLGHIPPRWLSGAPVPSKPDSTASYSTILYRWAARAQAQSARCAVLWYCAVDIATLAPLD